MHGVIYLNVVSAGVGLDQYIYYSTCSIPLNHPGVGLKVQSCQNRLLQERLDWFAAAPRRVSCPNFGESGIS